MTTDSTTTVDDGTLFLGEAWSDPIEAGIRDRIRGFIEELIEEELAAALGRGRVTAHGVGVLEHFSVARAVRI
ncbi:MAG: hypothetical protein GX886_03900 [Comamonadaceae bacterium]|nr:hypothetical protein [Comamonadaceae bacterium]